MSKPKAKLKPLRGRPPKPPGEVQKARTVQATDNEVAAIVARHGSFNGFVRAMIEKETKK